MTYTEAVAYLESLIDYERSPAGAAARRVWKLERMRALLQAAGDPHLRVRCVHLAGTKGKGSTAAMTASLLQALGLRVGLYTSPHLVSFRERIRLGGEPILDGEVVSLVQELQPVIEAARGSEHGAPSFFEVYTLLGFAYFARRQVDLAVLETGLGGRLDATNVVTPLACAITTIGLDHTQELGDTLPQIAREKAGIIKPGVPVISAPQAEEALAVLQEVALEQRAQLLVAGEEGGPQVTIRRLTREGMTLDIRGRNGCYRDLESPLLGRHQAQNAAVAVGLVELLAPHGIVLTPEAAREGLRSVRWPGRFQRVGRHPTILLDGAHDAVAAEALTETLEALYPRRRVLLVLGVSQGKDVEAIAAQLCPRADRVIATACNLPRALEAEELHRIADRYSRHVSAFTPVRLAVQEALDAARREDVVLITGSLYVVGEAMTALGVAD